MVRLTTISTPGWSRTVATSPADGTSYLAAFSRAASGTISPIASTSVSAKLVRYSRYVSLIVPAPIKPTPIGLAMIKLDRRAGTGGWPGQLREDRFQSHPAPRPGAPPEPHR